MYSMSVLACWSVPVVHVRVCLLSMCLCVRICVCGVRCVWGCVCARACIAPAFIYASEYALA